MAWQLGEYVVYGELRNQHYMTYGVIVLRGAAPGKETVIRLDLTGNPDPDLLGKSFRFKPGETSTDNAVFHPKEHRGFQIGQIGTTGTMTAQGWVRALPCPVEEYVRRADLGEPPPTEWTRRLYLEWYSQNGRVVVEMAGPIVEECIREPKGEDDEGDWAPLPNYASIPDLTELRESGGPSFTVIRQDGDEAHIEHWTPAPREDSEFDLIPDSLQRTLDREASAVDRAIRGEDVSDDDEDAIREMEMMDYCLDHCETQPIGSLLRDANKLPPPETLDDDQVEQQLKAVLMEMAMKGMALDVCEHFTPRDCYRLLRDHILPKENAYGELVGTGWAQHVCTWEHCDICKAKYEDEESDEAPPDTEGEED